MAAALRTIRRFVRSVRSVNCSTSLDRQDGALARLSWPRRGSSDAIDSLDSRDCRSGTGCAGPARPAGALEPTATARPAPFAGIVSNPLTGVRTRVGCFDALSLRASTPPVVIGEYHHAWSVSPDGSRVALGISAPGVRGRIGVRIVELGSWTTELDVETGIAAAGLAWLTDRRLVAALLDRSIVLLDPVNGAVVERWAGGSAEDAATARTRRRFLTLVSGRRVSRLSVVDAKGRLRRLSLRIPADAPGRTPPEAGTGGRSAPRARVRADGRSNGDRHRPSPDARSQAPACGRLHGPSSERGRSSSGCWRRSGSAAAGWPSRGTTWCRAPAAVPGRFLPA